MSYVNECRLHKYFYEWLKTLFLFLKKLDKNESMERKYLKMSFLLKNV